METKYLKINPADNVAVAIVTLPAGEKLTVDGTEITLSEEVPAGHKFALKDFAEGENVIKYGYPIGHARTTKKQGDWMNENNIQTNLAGLLDYTYNPTSVTLDIPHKNLTFKGYTDRRLREWYHQPTGRRSASGNRQQRSGCDYGISAQLWLLATGRRPRKH